MAKITFDNAILLSAKIKKNVKKEGTDWVETGGESLELVVLIDSDPANILSGEVKTIRPEKDLAINVSGLVRDLERLDIITINGFITEYKSGNVFTYYSIMKDDVDLIEVHSLA